MSVRAFQSIHKTVDLDGQPSPRPVAVKKKYTAAPASPATPQRMAIIAQQAPTSPVTTLRKKNVTPMQPSTSLSPDSPKTPLRKRKVAHIEPTSPDTLNTPTISKYFQVCKKPKTESPAESPEKVKSPMKYHYLDKVDSTKKRDRRGWKKKPEHTLAPGSAEKQAKVIERNYDKIHQIKRNIKFAAANGANTAPVNTIQVEDATIQVKGNSIRVQQNGRDREFGLHHDRLYPKSGTGIFTLPGAALLTLLEEHQTKSPSPTFEEFVRSTVPEAMASFDGASSSPSSPSSSS